MSVESKKPSVARFRESLEGLFSENRFVIFLCGPSIVGPEIKPSAILRQRLIDELENHDFEVVLGEDDGLEDLRARFSGMAHENELQYVNAEASAVVLIADSVGSFCELGLFSYTFYADEPRNHDFLLLVNGRHKGEKSYFIEGPAAAVDLMGGKVFFDDFEAFDTLPIIERLMRRRAVWFTHKRGRPSRA
ncbi:MAG: hypothetical protein KAG82_08930 [Alcanivoracaceae bacterium]|nr:hypothetical protein [Alcanivoracaceae bacterium]